MPPNTLVSFGTYKEGRSEGFTLEITKSLVLIETHYRKGETPVVLTTTSSSEDALFALFARRMGELQHLPGTWFWEEPVVVAIRIH